MSDRKYKHKGYQDSGGSSSYSYGGSKPQTPRPDAYKPQRMEGAPRSCAGTDTDGTLQRSPRASTVSGQVMYLPDCRQA